MRKAEKIRYMVLGMAIMLMVGAAVTPALAASYKQLNAYFSGIRIVVDGSLITPTDANGVVVEPFAVDGTTYLPVRALGNALGKAVSWDGQTSTVYLGSMDGTLEYPTLRMKDARNISGKGFQEYTSAGFLTDNYGRRYTSAMRATGSGSNSSASFQTLLNMQYSAFKGTFYVMEGADSNAVASFYVEADGKVIYQSPDLTKVSSPVTFNINVKGCNDFKLYTTSTISLGAFFGDAGFYQ